MEGALSKWTNVMKGWQYRWFVLDEHAGLFSYYTRYYTSRGNFPEKVFWTPPPLYMVIGHSMTCGRRAGPSSLS